MANETFSRSLWTGNPEDFSEGGRDNVDAEVLKVRFAPDHYPKRTKHFCFARVTYRTLEDPSEDFTEKYKVNFLEKAIPTNSTPDTPEEEREPSGGEYDVYKQLAEGVSELDDNELEDYEGVYLMGKPQKGSDFLIWLSALLECGYEMSGDPSVTQLEGLQLHLDRGKGSTYKDKESGEEKASSILLPSAILGNTVKAATNKGKASAGTSASASASKSSAKTEPKAKAANTSSSKSAAKSNSNGSGAAVESAAEAIREIIENDGADSEISKGVCIVKLTKKEQFKSLSAADRKAVIEMYNDDSLFSPARGLIYDADDDVIRTLG